MKKTRTVLLVMLAIGLTVAAVRREIQIRRLQTVRTMALRSSPEEIIRVLGEPSKTSIKNEMTGYRGPLDWSNVFTAKRPWGRLPTRTWILLEKSGESNAVSRIWWENRGGWKPLFPVDNRPGLPPGWSSDNGEDL